MAVDPTEPVSPVPAPPVDASTVDASTVAASMMPLWVQEWVPVIQVLLMVVLIPFFYSIIRLLRQISNDRKEHSTMLREWVADEQTRRLSEKGNYEEQLLESQTQLTNKSSEIQTWQDKYNKMDSEHKLSLEAIQVREELMFQFREQAILLRKEGELQKERIEMLEVELNKYKHLLPLLPLILGPAPKFPSLGFGSKPEPPEQGGDKPSGNFPAA